MYYIFWKVDSDIRVEVQPATDEAEQSILARIQESGSVVVDPEDLISYLEHKAPGNHVSVIKGNSCSLRLMADSYLEDNDGEE